MSVQLEAELQLPPALINNIEIEHRRSEGGYLIVRVPLNLVNREDVPVDHKHVSSLIEEMEAEKKVNGGTGQIDPIQFGVPPGATKFEICDGYHRDWGNFQRKAPYDLGTIRPNSTWEYVYDRRITASTRVSLQFARMNRWMNKVWGYSGLADDFTHEQAFAYYLGKDYHVFRDADPAKLDRMKNWVETKSGIWKQKPDTIYRNITKARGASPIIIDMARGGQRGIPTSLTPTHVENIAEVLKDKLEIQVLVAKTAESERISALEAYKMAKRVANAPDVATAEAILRTPEVVNVETSPHEKRRLAIEALTKKVTKGIETYSQGKILTPIKQAENTAQLIIGSHGAVAEQARNKPPQADKYTAPIDIYEKLLFGVDLTRFAELSATLDRHMFASGLLSELQFSLDPSTIKGLYPSSRDGVDWIKMAHPKEAMIACCFGRNGFDKKFTIDGVQIIYSENYQGVAKLQANRQAEDPTRIKQKSFGQLPDVIAKPIVEIEPKSEVQTEPPFRHEDAPIEIPNTEHTEPDDSEIAKLSGLLMLDPDHQELGVDFTPNDSTDKQSISSLGNNRRKLREVASVITEVYVPIQEPVRIPITLSDLKTNHTYRSSTEGNNQSVIFRVQEGDWIRYSDILSPTENRKMKAEEFIDKFCK